MMSTLELLNSLSQQIYMPIEQMQPNLPYRIKRAKRVDTQYGERIRVDLQDHHYLFLPQRYCELMEDTVSKLNNGEFDLIKRSSDGGAIYDFELRDSVRMDFDSKRYRPYVPLCDLPYNEPYNIMKMAFVDTQYGEALRVDNWRNFFFLPKSFFRLANGCPEELSNGGFDIIKTNGSGGAIYDFKVVPASITAQQIPCPPLLSCKDELALETFTPQKVVAQKAAPKKLPRAKNNTPKPSKAKKAPKPPKPPKAPKTTKPPKAPKTTVKTAVKKTAAKKAPAKRGPKKAPTKDSKETPINSVPISPKVIHLNISFV